jgi:hypothetical protein
VDYNVLVSGSKQPVAIGLPLEPSIERYRVYYTPSDGMVEGQWARTRTQQRLAPPIDLRWIICAALVAISSSSSASVVADILARSDMVLGAYSRLLGWVTYLGDIDRLFIPRLLGMYVRMYVIMIAKKHSRFLHAHPILVWLAFRGSYLGSVRLRTVSITGRTRAPCIRLLSA